jgi:hypothetical protein
MPPKLLSIHGLRTMYVILIVLSVTTKIIPYLTPELTYLKKTTIYSLPAAWNAAGDLRFYQNKTTFKLH